MKKRIISINDEQKAVKIPSGVRMLLRRCCNATLSVEKVEGNVEVSITFVDNERIQELNKRYRNIDAPTDVLSFPMSENGEYEINLSTNAKILGDIVISAEKAYEQAEKYGHSFQREMSYLTTHSMLHLLGYDHEVPKEKAIMREREEFIMAEIGLPLSGGHYVGYDIEKNFKI
ncbi:MAG: rRNA maturation RNase YbeY [Clostridia bacterium]|nr:rRNA maturation RNase YbeY [Clostridia bacterium]